MKKNKAFPKKTALLLTAAAVLLAGSGIGSARAALTYYSENYTAEVDMSHIGVTLNENGTAVSYRNYSDESWSESGEGTLLAYMNADDFTLNPGQTYKEAISVTNSGDIASYVRVIITKSWQDASGAKDTTLDPSWIELNLADGSGWVVDEDQSTAERTVLYYTSQLPAGDTTKPLSDTICINNEIAESVSKVVDGDTTTYVYDYNGYTFTLDAEVDAVQTHNAQAAIKSAWGVDVNIADDENGTLSLQ